MPPSAEYQKRLRSRKSYERNRRQQLQRHGWAYDEAKAQAVLEADAKWRNCEEFLLPPDVPQPEEVVVIPASALPPAPTPEPVEEEPAEEEAEPLPDDYPVDEGDPNLVRDILWVYAHLERKRTRAKDAPSAGAWSMLQWARRSANRFYESLLPKALAEASRVGADEEAANAMHRKQTGELQEALKRLVETEV